MRIPFYAIGITLFFPFIGFTQPAVHRDSIARTPVKSGLSYEALTQFFQSSLSTGRHGGFDFKSSLFGINKLFSKKDLDLSDYYLREQKFSRNLEFTLGVHKDDDDHFNTLLGTIKYALINNRSKSDIDFTNIPEISQAIRNMGDVLYKAELEYQSAISKEQNEERRSVKQKEFDNALKKYSATLKIKDLPAAMQHTLDSIIRKEYGKEPETFFTIPQSLYDIAAKKIDQQALLTIGISPGYAWSGRRLDSSTVFLQYLKGFGNYKKPWNIDGQLMNRFLHDTTGTTKNLSRSVAVGIIGLNKTLVNDDQLNPLIEFELAFEADVVNSGLYTGEDRGKLNLNTILRVHISRELSVPVTLQFDLKHPQLFGFLKVDWNLENNKKK
jgi:hypothetical protein